MDKRMVVIGLNVFLLLFVSLQGAVFAQDDPDSFEMQLKEWDEEGVDPNHTEALESVRTYIEKNVADSLFASMHIDRDERPLGVIVLSFTDELPDEQQREIENIVQEPARVAFRKVDYTEEQLLLKQQEIDQDLTALEKEGITIWHTGTDIIKNRVEIGIEPYNEETATIVHDAFGKEMVAVVEGVQVETLEDAQDASTQAEEIHAADEPADLNFIQRLWQTVSRWLSDLF